MTWCTSSKKVCIKTSIQQIKGFVVVYALSIIMYRGKGLQPFVIACKEEVKMKSYSIILKTSCIVLCLLALIFAPLNCAYATKEELLDLEEEKSDIEDRIEARRARGQSYEDLEERRNDVQDEIDSVREEG